MIERIEDMPAGTVGLRASGRLTREDYRKVLEPGAWLGVGCQRLRSTSTLQPCCFASESRSSRARSACSLEPA